MKKDELIQLGEKLKQAREAQKIALEKIADRTKININFLKNMEEGKFDFLPELYVRNFLKLYLQQLGVDNLQLLKEYDSLTKVEELKITVVSDEDLQKLKKKPPTDFRHKISTVLAKIKPYIRQMNSVWLAAGALVVFLIVYSLLKSESNQQIISAGSTTNSLLSIQKRPFDTVSSVLVNERQYNKELILELTTLETTWLQINVDDSLAEEHIFNSGMTATWRAKAKFKFLIGNAAGIRLVLNGQDLGSLGKPGQVVKFDLTQNGIQRASF